MSLEHLLLLSGWEVKFHILCTKINIQNLSVNASIERDLGDLNVDGRTEISWHTSVNRVASHGFDSRKEQGYFPSSHQQQVFWAPLRQSKGRSGYFRGYKEAMKAVRKRRAVKQSSLSRSYLKSLFELHLEIYFDLRKKKCLKYGVESAGFNYSPVLILCSQGRKSSRSI
jgi:hypothetical protein